MKHKIGIWGSGFVGEELIKILYPKNQEEIRFAWLVSNPGCYATAIELALLPLSNWDLISQNTQILIEAFSGYTGGGKKIEIPQKVTPYSSQKMNRGHQHVPEIEQTLGLNGQIHFFPHIAPWPRGIEAKIKLKLHRYIDLPELYYIKYYHLLAKVFYVDIGMEARRENVIGTNQCQIFPKVNKHGEAEISVALDNLGKGAAGQAVQNLIAMNSFFGKKVYENE